ncbi:CopY/TcrY family copper transport repressor [Neisseria sp. Ec49-e6-T10]|uniref:CopY/TcrY family copper transport repressor n=1 Tax=Neisseria sp. Ec49-e6-T10 TaxID=3140744 RepID=UPI003EBA27E8
MEQEKARISDAEWAVMRVVWSQPQASSQEIIALLQQKKDWQPTTIKTLLGRLIKKNMVGTQKDGKRYLYFPLVSEQESFISATENLFAHICSKKIGKTIAQLIDDATLTHQDIALIETSIKNKKTQAVDSIACNCIPGLCECKTHC